MTNNFKIGQIVEGKITGIRPYGALVSVTESFQGLIHISEIAHGFVNDVNDYLSVGQSVKAKIINIDDENNRLSLSIRATKEVPKQTTEPPTLHEKQNEHVLHQGGFNTMREKLEAWKNQINK